MPRVLVFGGYPHAVRPPDPSISCTWHARGIVLAGGDSVDDPHCVVDENFSGHPSDYPCMDLSELRIDDLCVRSFAGHVRVHAFEARVEKSGHKNILRKL